MKKIIILLNVVLSLCLFSQAGTLDMDFNPKIVDGYGFNITSQGYPVSKVAIQNDGKILVCGRFTTYRGVSRNRIARLNTDGTLDPSFNPGEGANNSVQAIAIQNDGKILIGGYFTSYDNTVISKIARLNTDGSLDTTFNPGNAVVTNNAGGIQEAVFDIKIQPDGRILVGKITNPYEPTIGQNNIIRLNNNGTVDTSFNIGIGMFGDAGSVYSINVLSNGKLLIAGRFTSYNGSDIKSIARLNADGSLDTSFNSGFDSGYIYSTIIQPDGRIIVSGSFFSYNGVSRNNILRLNANGSLDTSFDVGTGFNNAVMSISLQSDGRIVVGGWFTSFNGVSKNRIARLNTDGTLDSSLNIGTGPNGWVYSVPVQLDGKIFIGGLFTSYNGASRNYIARVNSNGSLDSSFNLGEQDNVQGIVIQEDGKALVAGNFTAADNSGSHSYNRLARIDSGGSFDSSFNNGGSGADNVINAIDIQPDEKILIGGAFSSYNGSSRKSVARLNTDGSLDNSFNPGTGANNPVFGIVSYPDKKAVIAGQFTSYNNVVKNRLVKVNNDGSIDESFNIGLGTNDIINAVALQDDGKVIIAGWFTSYNGTLVNRIARINSDGSLDSTFNIGGGFNSTIRCVTVQPDGKVLVGGGFTAYNGTSVNNIVRLNPDGTLDATFTTSGTNSTVRSIIVQPDGRILIGGIFTSYNGISVNRFVRLNKDGSLDVTFNAVGAGADDVVYAIALQPDGKVVLGGGFTLYNGVDKSRISRVDSYVPMPEADGIQNFCGSNTLANLVVSGANLKWYDSEYGGTLLPSSTVLTNSQIYYVSQTKNNVESARFAIKTPNETTMAPTGESVQTFESGDDLSVLIVNGENIKWYTTEANAANHTNVLPITTKIVNNTTYYATQTIGICESSSSLAVKAYNETLNVSDVSEISKVKLYPNPVKDILSLNFESKINKVIISDYSGRQILEKSLDNNKSLNIQSLSKGTYLIQIYTDKEKQTIKFIKD